MNESRRMRSIYRMAPTYHQLRRLHFRITLKAWLLGLDKAFVALAGVLPIGFLAVLAVFVLVQADALRLLLQAETPLGQRLAVIAGWQAVTFVLLRALREAVFMPQARTFFATLPLPPSRELRSDLVFASQSYSIAWAPLVWVAFTAQSAQALSMLASLAALSLAGNLALLRGRMRYALPALAALAVLAVPASGNTGAQLTLHLARLGGVVTAAFALWYSYLPGAMRARAPRTAGGVADRVAKRLSLSSGLALPFLAHELRSNLLIRVGVIAGVFGACLALNRFREDGDGGVRALVFVGAAAAIALYPLPALWRTTLLSKLHFLSGHATFLQRIRLPVYGIPTLLFGAALAGAFYLDAGESTRVAAPIFCGLFAAGAVAARCGVQAATWLMPLGNFVVVIILGGIL